MRTSDLHRQAERTGIIADILHGRADAHAHASLMRNLLPAYDAMEMRLAHAHGSRLLRAFTDPALRRAAAIRADLSSIDPDWRSAIPLLPAGERYAARIVELSSEGDLRLAAHAYVRYFGDLSGGQILKPLLQKTLGLPEIALTFYDFATLDPHAAKETMRAQIDEDAADLGEVAEIVEEARVAFTHNIAISEAVRVACVGPVLPGS